MADGAFVFLKQLWLRPLARRGSRPAVENKAVADLVRDVTC